MPLLHPKYYERLFAPLLGKKIGFYPLDGNVGDQMSWQASRELLEYYEIDYRVLWPREVDAAGVQEDIDEIVISGGGNMGGTFYARPYQQRQVALRLGLPVTVFPQTFTANEEDTTPYKKVYVRERHSLSFSESFELAPDMALALRNPIQIQPATQASGVFLRTDVEAGTIDQTPSLGDPAGLSATVAEYLELAAHFHHVVTDRLHFAIAALLQGRRVTLLPNSYWKNRAMYDTWLQQFDCQWRETLAEFDYDREAVEQHLLLRLAGPPSRVLDWQCRPHREAGFFLQRKDQRTALRLANNKHVAWVNDATESIWELCDGARTIEQILMDLVDLYPQDRLVIARDLQTALAALKRHGAIVLDEASPAGPERGPPVAATPATVKPVEIRLAEPASEGGITTLAAVVKCPEWGERRLWFRVEEALTDAITERADPFLLAVLMHAMRQKRPLVVTGAPVSAKLLRNLEQFQQTWTCWRTLLGKVEVEAEEAPFLPAPARPALLAFSGGVDSCYSAFRYLRQADTRHHDRVTAALMMHGFDIPIKRPEPVYASAFARSRRILDDVGVDLLGLQTNAKIFASPWVDGHGLMLAAALTLFGRRFGAGIVPSTLPYNMLAPVGSNPVTDWMMGSAEFEIIHHGANANRMDKIKALSQWPAALRGLRVCWRGEHLDRNCGRCPKCVLTHLSLWSIGIEASCFDLPLGAELVQHALDSTQLVALDWSDIRGILRESSARGLQAPWVATLEYVLAARN